MGEKAVESARKPTRRTADHSGGRLEDARNPLSPMDSTGSMAPRLTASDSGLILG